MFQGIIRGKKKKRQFTPWGITMNGIPLRDELNSDARQLPSIPYRDTITLSLDRAGHLGLGEDNPSTVSGETSLGYLALQKPSIHCPEAV